MIARELTWEADELHVDGELLIVNGCRATVRDDYAHPGGETIAVRGYFGGEVVFYREVVRPAQRRIALAAARKAVEKHARKHLEAG